MPLKAYFGLFRGAIFTVWIDCDFLPAVPVA